MSGDKKKGGGFLGDDDLLAELDAWDKTFDALHEGAPEELAPIVQAAPVAAPPPPEPELPVARPAPRIDVARSVPPPPKRSGRIPVVEPPIETPPPEEMATLESDVRADAVPEPAERDEDHYTPAPEPIDEELAALPPPEVDTSGDEYAYGAVGDETDFSEVAPGAMPAALGAMLGATPAPTVGDDAMHLGAAPIDDPFREDVFGDDNVYTSASRPLPVSTPTAQDPDFDEGSARHAQPPSPRRSRPTTPFGGSDFDAPTRLTTLDEQLLESSRRELPPARPSQPPTRTGPAVVRREKKTAERQERPQTDRVTPAGGIPYITDDGATRIADMAQMEAQAQATAQQFFAELDEPVITLEADESAYDDIELDQNDSAVPSAFATPPSGSGSAAVPSGTERRTTAHVVRRTPATRPPPMASPDSGRVIEMEADDAAGTQDPIAGELKDRDPLPTLIDQVPDDTLAKAIDGLGVDAPDDEPDLPPRLPKPTSPPSLLGREQDPRTFLPAPQGSPPVDPSLGLGAIVAPSGSPGSRAAPEPDGSAATPSYGGSGSAVAGVPRPMPEAVTRSRSHSSIPHPIPSGPVSARVHVPTSVPPMGTGADRSPGTGPISARVKTPTSVPPLGGDPSLTLLGMGAAVAGPPGHVAEGPDLDLDAIRLPEQVEPELATGDEAAAALLLVYERELETTDDSGAAAALRVESGRLCERLGDPEHARIHYEAALIADPRSTAALRGLRRIARASADLSEATRHLDAELMIAGGLEKRPLALHRVDLLMAAGEQDLARVAVGELLDESPHDVRGLLANLELAFLDGRADEFDDSLARLGDAVADPGLRAVALVARGHLGERGGDTGAAHAAFTAALAADPQAEAAALGAARIAAQRGDPDKAGAAIAVLASRLVTTSPTTAAAMALRAAARVVDPAVRKNAIEAALAAAPSSPMVAAAAADAALGLAAKAQATDVDGDAIKAMRAGVFRHLASTDARPGVRGYAAAMAAELTPALVDALALWQLAAAADPGDDYAAAQLRAAYIAGDDTASALEFDRSLVAADPARERVVVRAAYGLAARNEVDAALALIDASGATALASPALVDARADILAAAGRWEDRAKALAAVAEAEGGAIDKQLALIRAARAWDDAAAAAADPATSGEGNTEAVTRTAIAALDAWAKVLDEDSADTEAHGSAVALAERLGDRDILFDALTRAQTAERSPTRALAIALRRARAAIGVNSDGDLGRAEEVLRDASGIGGPALATSGAADPRRIAAVIALAARTGRLAEAATALDERAEAVGDAGRKAEAAALRYRAGQLWLAPVDDAGRAAQSLSAAVADFPQLVAAQDLLATARRRSGDAIFAPAPAKRDAEVGTDAFARLVREAELAADRGDPAGATSLLGRALELRPGDPLAQEPLVRYARRSGQPGPVSQVALAALRAAEEMGDANARADAYEQLARIDAELRGDPASAMISWQAALDADPKRYAVLRQLERAYLGSSVPGERWSDLARLRDLEGAHADRDVASGRADAVALAVDRALLAERHGEDDDTLRAMFRAVVELDPRSRLGLFHLESIVRRQGSTPELAELEERIADWFADDADAQAAFLTRAGETLTDLGQLDQAIARFKRAAERVPGHVPALAGWRAAALKGELWIDVAEAAQREAEVTTDDHARAQLYHLAGVALMDRALVGERAMGALHKALAADPRHHDAFVRLRILLEEDANHDDLAGLLSQRLDVETEPRRRIELHRAVAELHRNFLDDRDTAKRHFRAILEADASDLRAIAAVSDICFEQGQWAEAAEALMARAKLEQEPAVLKNLFFRLGLIYADRIPDAPVAIKAFQRVLSYAPDDENALDRLADLAMQTGEWKMALGACERLVKAETDPDRRVRHLHRVAKIFRDGMEDRKRAERALNLALDSAPASDVALAELIRFYREANDTTSTRVHLNRVAGAMRARVAADPRDGVAARVLSRAMAARHQTNVPGSLAIARAGAELALLVGGGGAPEQALLAEPAGHTDLTGLLRPEADEILFPRTVPTELRQLLVVLGDRIAKHVGVDLRPYGATRGDRLRAKDSLIAAAAQDLAASMGLGEIDVYLSSRQPWAMVAEPTSPVSLVLGVELARGEVDDVRFAAGGALKLAQASMAIPFRLAVDELGALVVGLIRLFQPEFPAAALEPEAVTAQTQKLKRLIPSGLMNELRPFALAIDPASFDDRAMAAGVRAAAYRAGLVASGSLGAAVRVLAGRAGAEPLAILDSFEMRDLIAFALGEDHAQLAGG
jgi:cellulose synthase operon protein C